MKVWVPRLRKPKVSQELLAYESRLRRLILGVYMLPFVAVVATIYFTNFTKALDGMC